MRSTPRGGPRRVLLAIGLASVALLLVGLAPARADEPVPFQNGTASATAIVTRVTPGVGSLPTGLFGGVALSNVTNSIAQAQAETLDFGLIGDLIVALDLVDSDDLPGPLSRDNRQGDAAATEDDYPISGTTLGGGHKEVHVTKVPGANASSTLASSYGDIVKVAAGRAESSSEILPGRARQAEASVSVDIDIAGLVHLSGLRWEATHRTGEGAHADASFGLKEASIGGVPLPLDSLQIAEGLINAALAPLGVSVQLPRVERQKEPTDVVRVTSLRVMLKDTPAGKAALGPVLNLSREQREQLFDQLTEAYGGADAILLAADVATSIVAGTGFLSIEVGGAEATSGPLPVGEPIGAGGGTGTPASGPTPTLPPLPSSVLPGGRAVGAASATPVRLRTSCESEHHRRPLGCSDGSLVPIGLAGLAVVAGVAVLDLRHQRRQRLSPAGERAVIARVATPQVARRRVARGYLPLAGASVGFLVLAAQLGVPRVHVPYAGEVLIPDVRTPELDASGAPVIGPLDPSAPGSGPALPAGSAAAVRPCTDRTLQVPTDPYSPPCYAFAGDNGGATTPGVTRDTIRVSARDVDAGSATDIFAGLANQTLDSSPSSTEDTLEALAEYFSKHFQLYGRHLEIEYFHGQGNGINELLGGGKESALADAVTAAKELHVFADVSGITIPYADSLAQNGVVNFGSPYPSQKWYEEHRPYSWSLFSDGTNLVSATSSAIVGRYPPGSRAEHAGAALQNTPRRFAVIAPENAEYQESMNVLIDRLRANDIDVATNQKYKLDLASFPNQASNIIAQIKDAGVTSIVCICDPAMLAFGLTPKANEQDYEPEWITAGIVFVDQDVVAQTIDQRQWAHAFGTAYNAVSERIGGSFPYFAYKSVRPNDEPAAGVEELYYQMYLLVIGLQMAGPNLTPESFEQGMFAYPGAFGPRGTWDFGPGDYTPTNDYREIWWDPDRVSAQNDDKGAWAQLGNGRRWSPQHPPKGRAPFFAEG